MDQAVVERAIEASLNECGVEVQYDMDSYYLHYDPEVGRQGGYGIEIAAKQQSQQRLLRCKFLVGADGGRSWVRHQLGIEMEGERTCELHPAEMSMAETLTSCGIAQSWGVIDVLPLTNFRMCTPDCLVSTSN